MTALLFLVVLLAGALGLAALTLCRTPALADQAAALAGDLAARAAAEDDEA